MTEPNTDCEWSKRLDPCYELVVEIMRVASYHAVQELVVVDEPSKLYVVLIGIL